MKSTAKAQIEALLHYYMSNRAVGHTTTMIEGAKHTDSIVVVANEQSAAFMRERLPRGVGTVVSLTNLDTSLNGMHKPITIDNEAMFIILGRMMEEINERDRRIEGIKKQLQAVTDSI